MSQRIYAKSCFGVVGASLVGALIVVDSIVLVLRRPQGTPLRLTCLRTQFVCNHYWSTDRANLVPDTDPHGYPPDRRGLEPSATAHLRTDRPGLSQMTGPYSSTHGRLVSGLIQQVNATRLRRIQSPGDVQRGQNQPQTCPHLHWQCCRWWCCLLRRPPPAKL